MEKIKVLHLVEDLKIGGIERIIAYIAYGINKDKFDLEVWCLSRGGEIFEELRNKGVKIRILNMPSARNIFFLIRLAKEIRKEGFDILHTHAYTANTVGRVAGIFSGIKVIFAHVHSAHWNYPPKFLAVDRFLSFFTYKVICCSKAVADFVIKKEKIAPSKTVVIYNSLDIKKFEPALAEKVYNDKYRVGCIASLFEHKGHRYLFEAIKYIKDNFSCQVRLVLAGEGILKDELVLLANKLGIEKNVEFMGLVPDVSRVLPFFDVVVLASIEREGLSLSLLEAMAAQKPVVGTNVGGIPEIIKDGQNGFLVAPKDPVALAKALIKIFENPDKSCQMG
ncbi:glycosyltransferase, partial [bacterium]